MEISDLYQELILDHGTQPRNCCVLPNATNDAEGYNPLCGDKVHVYLKIADDRVVAASFEGNGCAISTASASLMTESLVGKSVAEVNLLFKTFQTLLTEKTPTTSETTQLGKLLALSGVKAFPMRIKCATLAWHTLLAALNKAPQTISTAPLNEKTS
jgi:nitrogen fixation NifU-like protein